MLNDTENDFFLLVSSYYHESGILIYIQNKIINKIIHLLYITKNVI